MSPDTSLRNLFNAALERDDPAERARFLDEACGTDSALREQVERLLRAQEELGAFMAQPSRRPANLDSDPTRCVGSSVTEKPGDMIGRYKLLQQIGEGGCGVVYMAEQEEPVRRRVALKVIKLGMDTKQVVARFEAERQALALMDHPNIAKVFDAGSTERPLTRPADTLSFSEGELQGEGLSAGRPFFVMELVRGIKITEYCDQSNLTTEQRLELFTQVCHAVQHAHQKGVIHRDLKPSNILVAQHDNVAVPKVIDFGIAKATSGQQLTDKTLFTAFEQFIGTPAYMSPEQAQFSGLDIDTRTDIYALGVLLYELLTGRTPFDQKELLAAGLDEMRRTIREKEPPKPSTRLGTMAADALTTTAHHRHTEPPKLIHSVRGDLDWIVMKCLDKDRTRRYETANGLAMDLRRHLDNIPVTARPPSRWYEFQKTVRRHKFGFAAASALIIVLALGVFASTWQAIRATRAEREQIQERQAAETARANEAKLRAQAEAEAARSAQVAAFMTDMLNGVRPSAALGRDTTMLREILDATTRRLDQLNNQPAVEADLRSVLGGVYLDLGEYQNSEAMFRAALALRREIRGNKHADVALSLSDLGEALRNQNRYDEAEPFFAQALAMQRELLGNSDPAVARTLYRLGMMHTRRQQGAQAEPLFREALAIFRQHPGEDLRGPLDQLALSLSIQGDPGKYAEAESIALECVALCRRLAPMGDPDLAYALYNFGRLFRAQGRHAEAEPYLREALEIRRKQLPRDHNDTLWSIYALASSLIACNQREEAEPLVDEFIRLAEGKANMRELMLRLVGNWATFLRQTSRFREAAAYFEKATELEPQDVWNWYEVATLYLHLGDVERYRGECCKMLDRFEKVAADDDPRIAERVAKACALAPDSVPDFSRAERMAERCVTGTEKHEGYRWFILAKALTDFRAGHHDQALVWLKRFAPKASGTHWDASAFATLAMAQLRLGHADEARVSLDAARAILATKPPDAMRDWSWHDWLHAEILCREAETLLEAGETPKTDAAK